MESNNDKGIMIDLGVHTENWKLVLCLVFTLCSIVSVGVTMVEYIIGVKTPIVPKSYFFEALCILSVISGGLFYFSNLMFSSRSIYIFHPETKKQFKGYTWRGSLKGEWENIPPCPQWVAFTRYNQSQEFKFMGINKDVVEEEMFEIRLVYSSKDFISLIATSEMDSLPKMVVLGKALAETYGVKYNDYVRDTVRRQKVIM